MTVCRRLSGYHVLYEASASSCPARLDPIPSLIRPGLVVQPRGEIGIPAVSECGVAMPLPQRQVGGPGGLVAEAVQSGNRVQDQALSIMVDWAGTGAVGTGLFAHGESVRRLSCCTDMKDASEQESSTEMCVGGEGAKF